MQHKCSRCHGEGEESYEEDGRMFTDVCYHCGGSGHVDDEMHFHDALNRVAMTLAERAESEYRKACNSDPDGDGYDLGAYENGMMPFDYFRCRVYERAPEIAEKLATMSLADKEFLIAWDEYIPEPGILEKPEPPALIDELLKASPEVQQACIDMTAGTYTEDDIPF